MSRLSTHSGKLERWLGKEQVEHLSKLMQGNGDATKWYGKPIAVGSVPGRVYVGKDGDFHGPIRTGFEASIADLAEDWARRVKKMSNAGIDNEQTRFYAGFSSLSDLINAATTPGKKKQLTYQKVGVAGTTSATGSLWQSAGHPGVGAAGSAAPGGRIPTSATTGALVFANPASGTQHLVAGYTISSIVNTTLLLYDRIFDVAKTMASTATEAVTGVPTRYTNTAANTVDSAENNFLFVECQTVLAATAHNWTTCLYTDQSGNTGATLPSLTGISSCAAQRIDMPLNNWFAPLATGDSGVVALEQMQCSASIATGAINFVMGHPIAWFAHPIINQMIIYDGVSTAFNFERIFDNACLALLEPVRPVGTASTYTGQFITVYN